MSSQNWKKWNSFSTVDEQVAYVESLPKQDREDLLDEIVGETDENRVSSKQFKEFVHRFDGFYKPLFEKLSKQFAEEDNKKKRTK